eukprot:gene18968-20874_t
MKSSVNDLTFAINLHELRLVPVIGADVLQADKKTLEKCLKDSDGNEYCSKELKDAAIEEDEDGPCFLEEPEETLFQWDPVESGYIRGLELESGKIYKMKTMALKPKLFEIPNFLTDEECEHIINKASGFGHSKFVSGNFLQWDDDEDDVIGMQDIKEFAIKTRFLYVQDEDIIQMFKDMNSTVFDDRKITKEEFKKLNTAALNDYMAALRETHPRFRDRFSEQTWLRQDRSSDKVLRKLRQRLQKLTRLPKRIIDGGEPLQVLRYDVHGHYNAHFDGQSKEQFEELECCQFKPAAKSTECRLCRYITVLYYLNNVEEGGETAFPVADDPTYQHSDFVQRKNGDFYNLSQFCYDSSVVVKPEKGKAVMWYNHHMDESGWLGERDDHSLHGGCDIIKGEKWVANNWIPAPEYQSRHQTSLYTRETLFDAV